MGCEREYIQVMRIYLGVSFNSTYIVKVCLFNVFIIVSLEIFISLARFECKIKLLACWRIIYTNFLRIYYY